MGPRAWWFGPPPVIRHAQVSPHKRGLARQLRQEGTDSERAAWELLRNRRTLGLKFRRQQPVRGYIVDFYCAALRLALEIDGSIHGSSLERFAYDLERDERLREHEIAVLHIRPQDVLKLPEILAWWLREHPLSREGEGAGGEVIRDRKRASDAARCAGQRPRRARIAHAQGERLVGRVLVGTTQSMEGTCTPLPQRRTARR